MTTHLTRLRIPTSVYALLEQTGLASAESKRQAKLELLMLQLKPSTLLQELV